MEAIAPYAPAYTPITTTASIDPDALFNDFTGYLEITNAATIRTYRTALRQLAAYFRQEGITSPRREDLTAYRAAMRDAGLKPGTITLYITAARLFFEWLDTTGRWPNRIAVRLKGEKIDRGHKKDYLMPDQVNTLLKSIDRSTLAGIRDYALLYLLLTSGMRTIEVERANVCDMQTIAGSIGIYVQGKGRTSKSDFVKIGKAAGPLKIYLDMRKARPDEPLFTSSSRNGTAGQALCTRSIRRIVKERYKAAGIDSDRLTTHSTRHTAVTLALRAGLPLQEVKDHARHANLNTTLIYAHDLEVEKNRCADAIGNFIDD